MTDQPVQNSGSSTNWIQQHSVAFLFTVLGTLISIAFLFGRTEQRLWLFLTVPITLLGAYLLLPFNRRNTFQNWLLDNIFALTTVTALWAIMVALILWAMVNFSWQLQYNRLQSATIMDADGLYVTTIVPGGVLANGQSQPVHFRLTNASDMTRTVTTTLQLPVSSALISLTDTQNSVAVAPGKMLTQTVHLAASAPPTGIRQMETVTVTAVSDIAAGNTISATLVIEGMRGESLRQFVTTTVDKASPLIIIIAFFIPILSTIVPKYLETYQAQKEADLQKAKEARRLPILRKAEQLRDQVRSHLQTDEIERAKSTMESWEQHASYQQVFAEDAQIGQSLLQLAQLSNIENITLQIQDGRVWPDACIAAFVAAWRKCRQQPVSDKCSTQLRRARYLLPVSQASSNSQDKLARIAVEIVAFEKERREFQPITAWPPPPQYVTGRDTTSNYVQQVIPRKLDPFAHERAEEDRFYLYRGRHDIAFWGGHPLFNELFAIDQSVMIASEPGSGRTTLAYALHYYAPRREVLALFIPGSPQPNEIRRRFAAYMLDFILAHPLYLRLLTTAERVVIAQLLAQNLGKTAVNACIEATHAAMYSSLNPVKEDGQSEEERIISSEQLQLLAKSVGKVPRHRSLQTWPNEVNAAAKALKFERVILVLDVQETSSSWLQNTLLPELSGWQAAGLQAVIFLPDALQKQITRNSADIYERRLAWTNKHFRKMLDWRYKAFAGRIHTLAELFEIDALDYMVAQCRTASGSYNPRRFIQLWQAVVAAMPNTDDLISQSHIEEAVQELPPGTAVPWRDSAMSLDDISETSPTPPPAADLTPVEEHDENPVQLRKILDNYFNLSELSNLCFDLSVDYEKFPDTKPEMILEVVGYFQRHNRFSELWEEVRRLRPNAFKKGAL